MLSGGEPLFRPDIYDIAAHATGRGLIVALATNATLVDADVARRIKESGVRRVSVSFDGADAATHDVFRGKGAFDRTLEGIEHLRRAGVPFQINTTVARHNVHQMPQALQMAKDLGSQALHLFLLVPVGCGVEIAEDAQITPDEYEAVLNWMYDAEMEGGIELKATCAPHYFRIVRQRQAEERRQGIVRERPASHRRQEGAGESSGGHPGGNGHPGNEEARAAMSAMTKGCLAGTRRLLRQPPRRGLPLRLPARRGRQHPPAAVPGDLGRIAACSASCATRTCWAASAGCASSSASAAAAAPGPTA